LNQNKLPKLILLGYFGLIEAPIFDNLV